MYTLSQKLNNFNPIGTKYTPGTYIFNILLIYIIYSVTILIKSILELPESRNNLYFIIGCLTNAVTICLVLQYVCIASIFVLMFKNINNGISYIKKAKIFVMSNFSKREYLSSLSEIYMTLCDLTSQVSNFFGFPILCCISYMLASLVGNLYFLLVLLIERKPIFTIPEYLHIFLLATSFMICIVSLTRTITEITNEVYIFY